MIDAIKEIIQDVMVGSPSTSHSVVVHFFLTLIGCFVRTLSGVRPMQILALVAQDLEYIMTRDRYFLSCTSHLWLTRKDTMHCMQYSQS